MRTKLKGNTIKWLLIISDCTIILLLGIIVWLWYNRDGKDSAVLKESIYLQNGDSVNDLPMIDSNGNAIEQLPIDKEYNLVVYLSDSCRGCIESLGTLKDIRGVFGENEMGYAYLYYGAIPRNIEDKYGIPKEDCYLIGEDMMLATSLPTFYLVDQDGIVFFTTTELETMIEKITLMEILPQEQLVEQANEYLLAQYFDMESDREKIIYFAMQGCSDCAKADEIINREEIQQRYEVVRIYRESSEDTEFIVDKAQLFRNIYGIEWYPSFEIIRGESSEFVGEVSLEELEAILTQ